jgi:hypothetical protein
MPARTKRRAKFDFHGRPFVWWIDGDKYLRIASFDKSFVISLLLYNEADDPPHVEVIGQEFPGIDPAEPRPVRLYVTWPAGDSMGAWVDELLTWAFDPGKELRRV